MVSLGLRKLQLIRQAADLQTQTVTFFSCKFDFRKCFGASFWSNHWVGYQLLYKIHLSLHITIQSRNGLLLLSRVTWQYFSKQWFFLICGQLTWHPLMELYHLSNLLQMLKDHRVVDAEFFSNFLHTCRRISLEDCSQLVAVNFWWLTTALLIFQGSPL